jgi:hypothetical protein
MSTQYCKSSQKYWMFYGRDGGVPDSALAFDWLDLQSRSCLGRATK